MTGAALSKNRIEMTWATSIEIKKNENWLSIIEDRKSNSYKWVLQHTLFQWNAALSALLVDDRAALPKNKSEIKSE